MREWTPCSEKLPEAEKLYLVTLKNGDIVLDCYTSGWVNNGWVNNDDVVAWMSLPKPYSLT